MRGQLITIILCCMTLTGCSLILPEVTHQPVIRNPFPQLSRVAIAPFFNHSDEPTLDAREVTMAYFAELQATPGFEVVPLNVVEELMITHQIDLGSPGEARRLAQQLGVDAVVVGAVTDYSPYYPPRMGLHVEWYTANPGYHEIPVGYGLPWNTPEEEFIPDSLVYESELALARAQLAKQAPACGEGCQTLPSPPTMPGETISSKNPFDTSAIKTADYNEELPAGEIQQEATDREQIIGSTTESGEIIVNGEPIGSIGTIPPEWPGESCFVPSGPKTTRPKCIPHHGPVLKHTRIFHGTDPKLTESLKGYIYFREDVRFGGWKSYLQRSDDFHRFCCHMHISEMLSARGGSHKTRLVFRWPESR